MEHFSGIVGEIKGNLVTLHFPCVYLLRHQPANLAVSTNTMSKKRTYLHAYLLATLSQFLETFVTFLEKMFLKVWNFSYNIIFFVLYINTYFFTQIDLVEHKENDANNITNVTNKILFNYEPQNTTNSKLHPF